jgi:Protein of unknown function (DUF3866)
VGLLEERAGLQRVEVELEKGPARAYVLTQLTGRVETGDQVVVNTTAVELGLGTGGWHVVHWNLARREWSELGPGHIIKARYTSLQADVGSTEEHWPELVDAMTVDGIPVVAVALHSQLPAVALAFKQRRPDARLAYVMTDAAALPLALSDLVAELRQRHLIDATITCGHAFGGDYEAVSVHSALVVARRIAKADAVLVGMGPGIVGTGTRLGFSGIEVGPVLDAAAGLGGTPIACLRASSADPRPRHRGISHHSITALTVATRSAVLVPVAAVGGHEEEEIRKELASSGIEARHEIVVFDPVGIIDALDAADLHVVSMGRPAREDPLLFEMAAVAGVCAAARVVRT